MGVEIPVEAKFESSDIDKTVGVLTEQLKRLEQAVAQANKAQYNPFSKYALESADKLEDRLKRILALHETIAKVTPGAVLPGSPGTVPPASAPSPATGGSQPAPPGHTPNAPGTNAPASSRSSSSSGGNPPGRWWNNRYRHPFNHTMAGRVISSGLNAAGPVGGVVSEGINSAYVGGGGSFMSGGALKAGLGGLLGGFAALGISKLVGGVMNKVGDAQNDVIGYDTLKRSLGDVNVGFSMLRASLHASSDAIDVNYAEVLKLGNEFAHISGLYGKQAENLAEEVRVGGGFGRSFGVDPSQSVAFFAQMRQFQVTNTDADSRRLALYVGEAVAKSGAFAKTGEMLQAIASYTSQQTRLGLTSANVGDYSSLLAGLVGSHTPGLDPMGAANLLSRVNGAFTSGGSAGEAGQNFMYMALGRQMGLDPIQASILREQGAFGTGAATFGRGSLYAQFADKYKVNTPGIASDSNETNLQLVMSRMKSVYANRPELMLSAMSNLFGVNTSQAMALATIGPDKLGGLQKALSANGVDLTSMSSTGISALAQIYNGSPGTLRDQAAQLWPKLSAKDAASLDSAEKSGDTEKFRGELIKLTAQYGQVETEGSKTRKTIQDLDKDMIDAASKLLGPLNTMRDTMLYAFGNRGAMSAQDIHKAVVDAQKKQINEQADARVDKAKAAYLNLTMGLRDAPDAALEKQIRAAYDNWQSEKKSSEQDRKKRLDQLDAEENGTDERVGAAPTNGLPMPSWMGSGASGGSPEPTGGGSPGSGKSAFVEKYMPMAQEVSKETGISPRLVLAQIAVETGWGKKELAGSNNPFNIQKGSSWQGQTVSATDHRADGRSYRAQFRAYDNYTDAGADYASLIERRYRGALNSGDDVSKFTSALRAGGYAESPSYEKSIASAARRLGTMLPASTGAPGSASSAQQVNITGSFTLNHPNGQPAAEPVTVTKKVGAPMAFGSSGSW